MKSNPLRTFAFLPASTGFYKLMYLRRRHAFAASLKLLRHGAAIRIKCRETSGPIAAVAIGVNPHATVAIGQLARIARALTEPAYTRFHVAEDHRAASG